MPWRLYLAELVPGVIVLELNSTFQVERICRIHPDLMEEIDSVFVVKALRGCLYVMRLLALFLFHKNADVEV